MDYTNTCFVIMPYGAPGRDHHPPADRGPDSLRLSSRALQQFEQAVVNAPLDAAAHRELGIAQNKQHGNTEPEAGVPALRRAIELAPNDDDALASLGGIWFTIFGWGSETMRFEGLLETQRIAGSMR